jgi:hypothetical protein
MQVLPAHNYGRQGTLVCGVCGVTRVSLHQPGVEGSTPSSHHHPTHTSPHPTRTWMTPGAPPLRLPAPPVVEVPPARHFFPLLVTLNLK